MWVLKSVIEKFYCALQCGAMGTGSDDYFLMSKWRPAQHIQVKVIGIAVNNNKLLAMKIFTDSGKVKGIRPLGGRIEFGETRELALRREFQEELQTEIEIFGAWRCFENIYTHVGKIGHEYIHGVGISLMNRPLYHKNAVVFSEDSGTESSAEWFEIDELKSGKTALFPDGLINFL